MALIDKIKTIADAIRSKTGKNESLTLEQMATEIANIQCGNGVPYITELYSDDSMAISYTSTTAGTAKTITGLTDIHHYAFILVIIENTDTELGSLKFLRSATMMSNGQYKSGGITISRYGVMQYYAANNNGAISNAGSTTYGIYGHTISTTGNLTIRARCNSNYFTSLTGTYKIRVLGIKMEEI